jgi:protein-tyrosine phosphatase
LNLLAVTGHYGRAVKELSEYLLQQGFYDLIGTDLHNTFHLDILQEVAVSNSLKKIMQSGRLINADL